MNLLDSSNNLVFFFLDSTNFDPESPYRPQALDAGNSLFCQLAFFLSKYSKFKYF